MASWAYQLTSLIISWASESFEMLSRILLDPQGDEARNQNLRDYGVVFTIVYAWISGIWPKGHFPELERNERRYHDLRDPHDTLEMCRGTQGSFCFVEYQIRAYTVHLLQGAMQASFMIRVLASLIAFVSLIQGQSLSPSLAPAPGPLSLSASRCQKCPVPGTQAPRTLNLTVLVETDVAQFYSYTTEGAILVYFVARANFSTAPSQLSLTDFAVADGEFIFCSDMFLIVETCSTNHCSWSLLPKWLQEGPKWFQEGPCWVTSDLLSSSY